MLPTSMSFRCSLSDVAFAHGEDRRGGRDGVADADDRFLRNPRALAREWSRRRTAPMKREREADPVDDRPVRIAAADRQQHGDGRAERRNLRQRQIDEDDAAFDHVNTEIGVNAGENQAGDERRRQKARASRCPALLWRPTFLIGVDQQVDVVVEQLDVVGHFLDAADGRRHDQNLRAGVAADRVRRLQIEATARPGPASRSGASSH